ncbi:helix-turn-helix transcriptional regulator [Altibacter sp.]|uniref:response regulator transcription factor n=1 Tax=Altibacter sp. TaxID=2024823 RepID=UPI000C8FC14A|nr:helix-turn-helix transcriptional regulator [Altibacter sp.]MAP54521.1 helix-turn-helix transcriptional regulator [Altibacter sp.]
MRFFICVISFFLLYTPTVTAQYTFSGYVDAAHVDANIYLSVVEDYRKISGVYPEQILSKTQADSTGFFSFSGNNLSQENKIYRIHIDTCSEDIQATTHFDGHCINSKEVIFIANNTTAVNLPFSFDNEMFCRILSENERANSFLKIDSLKHDMRFAFGSYRSEANRKLNSKKWFAIFQNYGEQLQEPLAELYSYAFLSDRTHNLYAYYLEDLKTNSYYNDLLVRLEEKYPNAPYTRQYKSELAADLFLVASEKKVANTTWFYILGIFTLVSLALNLYYFKRITRLKERTASEVSALSEQERKVLELILANKTNKEIASLLFVSVSTVKTHINSLYKKLKVTSREEVKQLFPQGVQFQSGV